MGTLFSIVEFLQEDKGDKRTVERAAVIYEINFLNLKGPRKLVLLHPGMGKPSSRKVFDEKIKEIPIEEEKKVFSPLYEKYQEYIQKVPQSRNWNNFSKPKVPPILILPNKSPRWNSITQAYHLNFYNRVTMSSVKNFQIVTSYDSEYVVIQFGRIGKDTFTIDFQYPMSAIQAFGMCLSGFDPKLACQ